MSDVKHSGPCDSFGICDECKLNTYEDAFKGTSAKLTRLERAYGVLKEALKSHTDCTTGYYRGQCTGDYDDAKTALAEAEDLISGKTEI